MIRPIVPPKDLLGLHYRLPYIFLLEPRAPIPSPTVRQQHPRVQAPPSAPFPPFSKLAVINFQRELSLPLSRKTNIFSNFSEKIASTDLADRFEMFQVFWGGLELILVNEKWEKEAFVSKLGQILSFNCQWQFSNPSRNCG